MGSENRLKPDRKGDRRYKKDALLIGRSTKSCYNAFILLW